MDNSVVVALTLVQLAIAFFLLRSAWRTVRPAMHATASRKRTV